MIRIALVASLLAAPLPALADEVTDTLQSALDAYNDGDIQYALEELAYAQQLLNQMKTASFETFLPEPPEGWTREITEGFAANLGFMGGGVGAEATYSNGSESFTITMMADNPMVAAMAPLLTNQALAAASGAKIVRVGRQKFVLQNGEYSGLVNNRVLVQGKGDNAEQILATLETVPYRDLGNFNP